MDARSAGILAATLGWVATAQASDTARTGRLLEGASPVIGAESSNSCTLLSHSDNSYENGYAWQYGGVVAPEYGAFAECYTLPQDAKVCAIDLDLTQVGAQGTKTLDAYCWSADGPGGEPGTVLYVVPNYKPGTIATWPSISRHRIPACCSPCISAGSSIWVGYWANWPNAVAGWYVGADLSTHSGGGCAYTNVAPNIGYSPSGWQKVDAIFGDTVTALGISVEYTDCCLLPDNSAADPLPNDAVAWWNPAGGGASFGSLPPAVDMISPVAPGVSYTTATDVQEAQGMVGRCFAVDGSAGNQAYIEVQNQPKLNFGTGDFTVEGWVCWHAHTHPTRYRLIEKGNLMIDGWAVMTTDQGNALHFHIGNEIAWSGFDLPDHEWAHLAITRVGKQITFDMHTVSGVHKVVTKTVTLLHNVSTNSKLYIGGTPAQLGASFTGLIDEMTLYDRALGASEIQGIFDAGCNGKAKPLPIASLNLPSVLCQGTPFIADGTASQFATSYSWCWTPVADNCQTPLPPYGACFAPCACPTWDFNVTPGNLPPGKYRIDLYISNDAGSDLISQCIELKGPPPVAAFTLPNQVCVGQPIVADASASQNASSYSWCWGAVMPDCQTVLPNPPGVCYAACNCPTWDFAQTPGGWTPGFYLIDLWVSNDCGTDHVSHCVEVTNAPPVASLSLPSVVCEGDPLIGDASASVGAKSYSWCWWPVQSDCQTIPPGGPYGVCYSPCNCPTWDFDQSPGNLAPGKYRIEVWVTNACGSDHVSGCVEVAQCGTAVDDGAPATQLELGQNTPNPFRGATTIRYALPEPGRVSIEVYDVSGRIVRHLWDGEASAGEHQARWDARDDRGAAMRGGIYFYRLHAGGRELSRKLLLIE